MHTFEILQTSKASRRECLEYWFGSDELTCTVCRPVLAADIMMVVEVFLMYQHYPVYISIYGQS
jgi:hypothetical protein